LLPDKTFLVEGTIVGNEKIPNFVSGRVNLATGQFQLQPQNRALQFTAMQPSPEGKVMAVRACEWTFERVTRRRLPGSLMLLDMQTGKTLRTLATGLESDAPCSMVFSSSGQRLAVLENWKLRVFETTSGDELPLAGEWKSERFWFLDEGRILARQESNGSIVGVNLDMQAEAFRWKPSEGQTGQVTAVELSLDGKLAAVGGKTGDLTLRNPRTGAVLHRIKPFELPIGGLGFSPDGSVLAAADEQRRLIAWKIGSLEAKSGDKLPAGKREIRIGD
jgi:WD40 repeat protein